MPAPVRKRSPARPAAGLVQRRAQRYAAYLTPEQAQVLRLWGSAATWFYNEAAASQLDRWRHGARVESLMSLGGAVRVAREAGCTFRHGGAEHQATDAPAIILHGALRQLAASWTRHLRMLAERRPRDLPLRSSPPGFRSRHRGASVSWQVQDGAGPVPLTKLITTTSGGRHATVGKIPGPLGPVRIRYHRPLPADALAGFLVLREDNGRWWLTVQYETTLARRGTGTGVLGIDRGVAVTAAVSNGQVFTTPTLPAGQQQRMLRLQRALSRKRRLSPCAGDRWVTVGGRSSIRRGPCPGGEACPACWKASRRYQQAKAAYLRLRQRETAIRSDAAHKASRVIADTCATAVFEDLDVSAMTASARGTQDAPGSNVRAKAGLNRAIAAAGWYQLETFTAYKARELVKVPAPYSSQTCPRCGHVCAENRPSRDVFRCLACSFTGHADIAAAINLATRHRAAAAGAHPAEARETCDRSGGQPVNAHPSATREHQGGQSPPGNRSHAGQEVYGTALATGPLVPAAWGIGTTRSTPRRRRPRHSRARSPDNGQQAGLSDATSRISSSSGKAGVLTTASKRA